MIASGSGVALKKVNLDQLKSAYLYSFAKFITWPDESFADNSSEFRICLFGNGTLSQYLNIIAKEQKLNNRDHKALEKPLNVIGDKNILTISDQYGFAKKDGTIEFFYEGGRIRFIINMDNIERIKLKVRANLFRLSKK